MDRGSTNGAVLFFLIALGYLQVVFWGTYHDVWNAIKTSARKAGPRKMVEFYHQVCRPG